MSDIVISRQHEKSLADARQAAERLAVKLKGKFDLAYAWEGDTLRFTRPGVSGELMLQEKEATLRIRLGFLLNAVRPAVEREVHRYFDEHFTA
ncbi:MAG: polyhydroxyalkanoic acid system family protein [Proteobacteria bacterium]|jgi:putative polyhydroxyalkanoate system protein|nr:polyhydroxyalkanoic acid system family protein [Pseudomonadota bacterium]